MRSVRMKLCGMFEAELLVYYQHRKFVSRAYENTGHFASREGISWDAGRRHLVNTYEVKASIGVIAGNTVWSMPERLECEVLQKARYINTLLPLHGPKYGMSHEIRDCWQP